jgi:LmbE family N-acetylglucosaminyl deacetylase
MTLLPEHRPQNPNPEPGTDRRPAWLIEQEGPLVKGSLQVSIEQSTHALPSDVEKLFYTRAGEMLDGQESCTPTQPIEPTIPDDIKKELETAAHAMNARAEQTPKAKRWRLFPENPKNKIRKMIKFLETH